jgi:hypothetical protein
MPSYYLLLDARAFHEQIRPALAASWRQRSFAPCQPLCQSLLPAARSFQEQYHVAAGELLLTQVAAGLPYDRRYWQLLAGEVLFVSATEIPLIQITPEVLCCLLAPEQYRAGAVPRERFAPIQQAYYGTREVWFGGKAYCLEHAGWNDADDVARLDAYLGSLDPDRWTAADLRDFREVLDPAERAEELELARDWFPELRGLYRRAHSRGQMVLCEIH